MGAAYSNNFVGATTTALYDIDSAAGTLLTQDPPNNGTLATVGALGLGTNLNEAIGFDIAGENGIAYATITTGGITRLYSVNLTSGAATLQSSNGGAIGTGTTPFLGLTATPKTVGFDSAVAAAGEGGTATLTVSRQGLANGTATVEYATSPGSAGPDQDFEPASGTLSWANGESTSKPITVAIKDDADPEDAETFTVTLSNPSAGTTLAPPATATVTIDASDQLPPPFGDPQQARTLDLGQDSPAAAQSAEAGRCIHGNDERGVSVHRGPAPGQASGEAAEAAAAHRTQAAVLSAGSRTLRVKPTRRAARKLRRLRKVRVTLAASCVDAAGNRGVANGRKLTLRR